METGEKVNLKNTQEHIKNQVDFHKKEFEKGQLYLPVNFPK
jgi:hypothetical protein